MTVYGQRFAQTAIFIGGFPSVQNDFRKQNKANTEQAVRFWSEVIFLHAGLKKTVTHQIGGWSRNGCRILQGLIAALGYDLVPAHHLCRTC
ncbi:Hypothetical protein GbCGDNIH1_5077 [Granulibacter bethesdensis CGDNIH1]|uniref:Uncharacterized protein n=1 Tax=Granulibacter bethesdensis (strain ATCC BAA-1260 / CGDNIH1) TaxID=391165 RepID=A0A286M326_GRABC|nr:Hypothetical protein GbCGDNIH5_5077 [Granulibacter bethesdensis]APH64849.1 Hypothetical protein GbCGDNIH1I4_5077 [Granulibacter bethesdensis]ASV62425.1 Hypothetical protein GbCGDNIH1_5077 [Granulibacter bethesdensis CGDNIH1]